MVLIACPPTIGVVRFVTWNLWAGDTAGKLGCLSPLPDVAVFCEVSRDSPAPAPDSLPSVPEWVWEGRLQDRGVAVASWNVAMQRVRPDGGTPAGHYGLGVELVVGLGVVGLWACPEETGRSYAAEVHSIIDWVLNTCCGHDHACLRATST